MLIIIGQFEFGYFSLLSLPNNVSGRGNMRFHELLILTVKSKLKNNYKIKTKPKFEGSHCLM